MKLFTNFDHKASLTRLYTPTRFGVKGKMKVIFTTAISYGKL
jgi:hypothetical protein